MLLSVLYYRPDFDDDDDEGNKLFRYICLSLIGHKASRLVFLLLVVSAAQSVFSLFFFRCDDETAGLNNDKERFAR